jgi:histidine ammonia-lyase
VVIGNEKLTINALVAVARHGARIDFSEAFTKRVNHSRSLVERFLKEGRVVYGMTTGFGSNCDRIIPPEDAVTLQKNIVRSHACSVGEPLEKEVVRGIQLMMIMNLGQGFSGVRIETLNTLAAMLNKGVTPYAPAHGSVGYLSIEAHISLVLLGEGKAWFGGELRSGADALQAAGLSPVELGCKEGLALVSGTTSVTALAALATHDAIQAARTADVIGAMSLEALRGTTRAFDPRLQSVRPHPDQGKTARNILRILENSAIAQTYRDHRLQDALSLRCMPQVHGSVKKTFRDAVATLEIEMNSCCDNPIIYPEKEDGIALMGCNADGSYVGLAADSLCIAMTVLAKMSERRTDRLVNHHVSELPAFLIENSGLNSGFMILQYTAAGLLGEMRILSTPASIDNTPTCANQEDYVSMGYNAAKKAYDASKLLENILAIELLNAAQAMEFHQPLRPSPATEAVRHHIREAIPPVKDDRFMHPDIDLATAMIHRGEILQVVESVIGTLEF